MYAPTNEILVEHYLEMLNKLPCENKIKDLGRAAVAKLTQAEAAALIGTAVAGWINSERDTNPPRVMKLDDLMKQYRPGSEDPPWDWADEHADLLGPDHILKMAKLIESIAQNGIVNPVLLGSDGRVWNGHHRIIAARALGLTEIPVTENVEAALMADL